ncbi:MAG: type II secretion system protein M [Elusimicrobia bacterium]|nr:type II secretion system protein M [Elusimicrobiota bacterium]
MAGKDIDLNVYLNVVKGEADLVLATIRHKGAKRFGKAFGMSALMIAAAYFGVYKPPQDKISRLTEKIEAARAMSQSSAAYKEVRDQLAGSYGSLPLLKDQQQWLSNAMIDSMRADNLTPEMFRPVVESEVSGLIFQTSSVQLTVKFNEIYTWLLRLEGATPMMHVSHLEVTKKPDMIGWNVVSASVMTAIPKKRFN